MNISKLEHANQTINYTNTNQTHGEHTPGRRQAMTADPPISAWRPGPSQNTQPKESRGRPIWPNAHNIQVAMEAARSQLEEQLMMNHAYSGGRSTQIFYFSHSSYNTL